MGGCGRATLAHSPIAHRLGASVARPWPPEFVRSTKEAAHMKSPPSFFLRAFVPLWFILLSVGCGLEPATPIDQQPQKKLVEPAGIAAEIRSARAESTRLYREQLLRIADEIDAGRITYDTKLQLELNQASRLAGAPIATALDSHLPKGKITDPKAVATAIRQIADGYQ